MRHATITVVLSVSIAATAAAQPARERGYVTFNAGIQPASEDLSDAFRYPLYGENASVDVKYPGKAGFVVDGGGGFRLWKRLGAGLAVSYRTSERSLTATGRLPHPFFLDRLRNIEGETPGVARTETGVHAQALYFLPAKGRWRIVLAGGPSFFNLEQDLASEIRYDEEYPYDTATFRTADVRLFSGTAVGFNAGADVTFLFSRQFGVGGIVRFTRASVDLDGPENRSIPVEAGGFQAGAGVRLVF